MNYPALPRIAEHANRYFDVVVWMVTMLLGLTAALVILSHLTDLTLPCPVPDGASPLSMDPEICSHKTAEAIVLYCGGLAWLISSLPARRSRGLIRYASVRTAHWMAPTCAVILAWLVVDLHNALLIEFSLLLGSLGIIVAGMVNLLYSGFRALASKTH